MLSKLLISWYVYIFDKIATFPRFFKVLKEQNFEINEGSSQFLELESKSFQFFKETDKSAYTYVRANFLKRDTKNNWKRYLREISVRILLKQFNYLIYNLVLSTELIMWISHRKEIRKLTFRAQALRRSESDSESERIGFAPTKGLRSKRQLSNLFTVANSHYQLSW